MLDKSIIIWYIKCTIWGGVEMSVLTTLCMIDTLISMSIFAYIVGSGKSIYQIAAEIREFISKFFKK